MSTNESADIPGKGTEKDNLPVVDPKAPVTNEQLELVIQGMGGLMDKALKTAATEFETIVKEQVKQMSATLEQHASAINGQNEVIKKIVERLNGGESKSAPSEGGPIVSVGKSSIDIESLTTAISGLLEAAQKGKALLKGDGEASQYDNLATILGKGILNGMAKKATTQVTAMFRKGWLTEADLDAAGMLENKVSDHATIK